MSADIGVIVYVHLGEEGGEGGVTDFWNIARNLEGIVGVVFVSTLGVDRFHFQANGCRGGVIKKNSHQNRSAK